MRLVPTAQRVEIIGYTLACAQARFRGIDILAFCQMSNHLHMVVRDNDAELSKFMQYFLCHLARRLNLLDGLRGTVFERRFSEITILDDVALLRRIAYTVANPVAARLVATHRDWAGLVMFAGAQPWRRRFSYFHEARYRRAVDAARPGQRVKRSDFVVSEVLEIRPVDSRLAGAFKAAVKARQADVRADPEQIVGMEEVLRINPMSRVAKSERSPIPLCVASVQEVGQTFREGWRAFVAAFRKTSTRFRAGDLLAVFPPGSFRPSLMAA